VSLTVNASVIIFAVTEDYEFGVATAGSAGVDATYIVVGSSTAYNTKAWGLLAWMLYANHIDTSGVTSTGGDVCTKCDTYF